MGKLDFISGLVLFAFGGIIFIASFEYPFGEISSPGPGFVPRIASLFLVSLSVFIMALSCRSSNMKGTFINPFAGEASSFPQTIFSKRIILTAAALFAYRLLFPILGFILTNLFFFILVIRILGYSNWKINLIVSCAVTVFAYLLFEVLLAMPLPRGILGI